MDTGLEQKSPETMTFSLIGCTVSPGFEFQDFILGERNELIKQFPELESIIS